MSDSYSQLGSPRRYYLAKRHAAEQQREDIADLWRHKQEAEPGTPLPTDFIFYDELVAEGYETVEDLTGASIRELHRQLGISERDSELILAALAAL